MRPGRNIRDVAEAVRFLASDRARLITGQHLARPNAHTAFHTIQDHSVHLVARAYADVLDTIYPIDRD